MIINRILVDTSILIDLIRRPDKKNAIAYQLTEKKSHHYISVITKIELYSGKSYWENSSIEKHVNQLLDSYNTVNLNETIILKSGEIQARYQLDVPDAIIASTSIVYQLPLVTLNKKHFQIVKGLRLYNHLL